MSARFAVCLLALYAVGGIVSAQSSGESVCARSDILLCEDWEDGDRVGWDWNSNWDGCADIVGVGGYSSPNAMRFSVNADGCECGWPGYYGAPSAAVIQNPLYSRFYLKYSANYLFLDWTDQKVLYPAVARVSGSIVWRIMMGIRAKSSTERTQGRLMYDALGHDPRWWWNGTAPQYIVPDRWYCIESEVVGNTVGQSDGRLRLWVDDELYMDHQNINLKTTEDPAQLISWMSHYYGGNPCGDHPQHQIWYDQIVVGRSRIGCGVEVPSSEIGNVENLRRIDN